MDPMLSLSNSPIQGMGAPPASPPAFTNAMPSAMSATQVMDPPMATSGGMPPGDAQDAMGTPEGAVAGSIMSKVPTSFLVTMVQGNFDSARQAKLDQELVWIKCHDNYRGTAPRPANEEAMRLRSKVTMKITRTKVAAAVARHKDIGFKWAIKPTPEPNILDFPAAQLKTRLTDILSSMQNQELAGEIKQELDVAALMQQVRDLARSKSDAMQTRIKDDLVEDRFDAKYDNGLLDAVIYGTMIFKGPLTRERRPGRWIRKKGVWGYLDVDPDVKLYRPEGENISPWDFYPDPSAWIVDKMDWAIVRNVMGSREVHDLIDKPGFDEDEVLDCVADNSGKWQPQPWEVSVFTSNGQSQAITHGLSDKLEVLDWWGYIKVKDLRDNGGKIAKVKVWSNKDLAWFDKDPDDEEVVLANIWVCGNHVLRAWHTPLKPRRLPFYVVPYERIPKSLWGQGVAWMMEDWQAVLNTVYRAMMDNMAISALPIGWFDRSRLNITDDGVLFPGKMYEMKDTDRMTIPPVQFSFPPNNVAHMRMIAEIGRANVQECTSLPDIIQGQMGPGGHRTAEGLSMLGGWADTSTRSVQKNIDQELTRPFIRALYFWEMQFSNDDQIKGDFEVDAMGVDSVMADEVLTKRMMEAGQMMQQNPTTAKYMNWSRFPAAIFKKMGIYEEDLLYTEAQVEENDKKAQEAELAMLAQQASNPALQPQMSEKDWLLKCLDRVPEDSPIMAPLLRKTLAAGGIQDPEIMAAINAVTSTNAHLYGSQLSDTDKAALEAHNAQQNASGSQPTVPGGSGVPTGEQAPVGPNAQIPG